MSGERPSKRRAIGENLPGRQKNATNKEEPLRKEIERLRYEMEPTSPKTSTSSNLVNPPCPAVSYRGTIRAVLAQKGYLSREKLGTGSYSQVRLAIDMNSPVMERVAVKIVDLESAPSDFKQRFLPRELQIWPRLNHSHIIKLRQTFRDSSRVFAVLEYASGGDALHYVQTHGAVGEPRAKRWMAQLGDAVRYLHRLQISHRDLKLENLLLDGHQNIKLCDFGFARDCDQNLSSTFCGSKSYASPEILSGVPYDPKKADIWALGVILFILVTGRMPFDESKGNHSLLQEHRNLGISWPNTRNLSASCKSILLSSMEYNYRFRVDIIKFIGHRWLVSEINKTRRSSLNRHGANDLELGTAK
ncbi:testis-specific serine/threonine-protein kinase 3-like [Tubulanus polymorphus]|uniref:testis-specific serine/threonine-protein kinase 3-like n=1 Tax=Tubulanus polymorphus TaxID=672921 RepID=UPI003DA3F4A3